MEADSTEDYVRAAEKAQQQLEQIRQAEFQSEVEQQKFIVEKTSLELVTTKDEPQAA